MKSVKYSVNTLLRFFPSFANHNLHPSLPFIGIPHHNLFLDAIRLNYCTILVLNLSISSQNISANYTIHTYIHIYIKSIESERRISLFAFLFLATGYIYIPFMIDFLDKKEDWEQKRGRGGRRERRWRKNRCVR